MTHDTEAPVGWDAIDAACNALYPDQPPQGFRPPRGRRLGGAALDNISVWKRADPLPHWHFVTYGFSELYGKEHDDPAVSGFGFELTFRLKAQSDEQDPPVWALNFLQNLGEYVFKSGNNFRSGDWMSANGPLATDEATQLCSMAFIADPELPEISTPHGRLEFLQVVGLTQDEERAAMYWQARKLLDVFAPDMPLWITDIDRVSLLQLPDIKARVVQGTQQDGSSTGNLMWNDALTWQRKPSTTITCGALPIDQLAELLPSRLLFGRQLRVIGENTSIIFSPGPKADIRIDQKTLHLTLPDETVREIAAILRPQRGTYALSTCDGLQFHVQPTQVTNAEGKIIRTVG